jgi:hypothetical protein
MESSGEQDMPEMRGERVSMIPGPVSYNTEFKTERKEITVVTTKSQLRLFAIWILTGLNMGITIASNLYRSLPIHRAVVWTLVASVGFGAVQIVLLAIEGFRLRRISKAIAEQRHQILADAKKELDELFPNQPVKVAGIMLHLQEKFFQ